MTPTQGSTALLTLISGTERILVTALVLSASPDAEGKPPLLNLAFLHPGRLDNLGSPDWRNAFDRRISVKHESHDDVQNSAEGCFWNDISEDAPAEAKSDAHIEENASEVIEQTIADAESQC